MSVNVRRILPYLLLLGACLVGAWWKYGASGHSDVLQRPQESGAQPGHLIVQEIWVQEARSHAVDEQNVQLVARLFREVVDPNDCQPVSAGPLRDSLDRYLRQFAYTFAGPRREGACYWMAWLLMQCASRPSIPPQEVAETRAWFQTFVDEAIEALQDRATDALGPDDYRKYQSQVEQALQWCRNTLHGYFEELHADPLFPVLKKPLMEATREEVLKRVRTETVLRESLRRPIPVMVLDEEACTKRLEGYFRCVPQRVMFEIIVNPAGEECLKPRYWGGMLASGASCGNGVWPIEMYLRPRPKVKPVPKTVSP